MFFPIKIKKNPFPSRKVINSLFKCFICVPMGDAWELDLVPRAYSPFKMADRHEEKQLSLLNTSENHRWVQKSKNSVLLY